MTSDFKMDLINHLTDLDMISFVLFPQASEPSWNSETRDYQGKRVNSHIAPLTKVIPLKLFLDFVPSSFADITRALRGCFRGGSVYVSFRFVVKQSKVSNSVKMSSLIFGLQAKELRLSVCCNTFRNFTDGV